MGTCISSIRPYCIDPPVCYCQLVDGWAQTIPGHTMFLIYGRNMPKIGTEVEVTFIFPSGTEITVNAVTEEGRSRRQLKGYAPEPPLSFRYNKDMTVQVCVDGKYLPYHYRWKHGDTYQRS